MNKFKLGEIVVFTSYFRFETYISRIMKIHLDYPNIAPDIRKATIEEKQMWYKNEDYELIIESHIK